MLNDPFRVGCVGVRGPVGPSVAQGFALGWWNEPFRLREGKGGEVHPVAVLGCFCRVDGNEERRRSRKRAAKSAMNDAAAVAMIDGGT